MVRRNDQGIQGEAEETRNSLKLLRTKKEGQWEPAEKRIKINKTDKKKNSRPKSATKLKWK